jgi:F0F1-type ATP synthase assembly protein I
LTKQKTPNKSGKTSGKNDRPAAAYKLTGMAIKMAVVIYLGIYLGQKIDGPNEGEVPWFTLVGALLGVGLSFYFVVKDLRDI